MSMHLPRNFDTCNGCVVGSLSKTWGQPQCMACNLSKGSKELGGDSHEA
jgi:hypothetical protein